MASCRKCGKGVGCGCNLNKEGLCAECAHGVKTSVVTPTTEQPQPKKNNVRK